MALADQGKEVSKLESPEIVKMTAYVKSLANGQKRYRCQSESANERDDALGQQVFEERRGGRGLSCNNCHSADIVGPTSSYAGSS